MIKTYETKTPLSVLLPIITWSFLLLVQIYLLFSLEKVTWLNWLINLIISATLVIQLIIITLIPKQIEIANNSIKTDKIEIPIVQIDKIIIEGYFIQNIGIKQVGKKRVSSKLYFRFKNDEEIQINEWKKWADQNGIKVINGTIFRW